MYELIPSMHLAPFWHRAPAQSLVLSSQFFPVNPVDEKTETSDWYSHGGKRNLVRL